MVLGPPWLRTSALGDSTRSSSARSSKRAPSSNATVSTSRAGLRRISLGQGLAEGIAFLIAQGTRLARQHHRHAAANGIGQAGGAGDQFLFLAVIAQVGLGQGADQDFEQFGISVHALSLAQWGRLRRPFPAAPSGWRHAPESWALPAAPVSRPDRRGTSSPGH